MFLAAALSAPQVLQAQGTVYVSSLGLTSTGSASVGSDSWLALGFWAGTNAGGFTAMIYDAAAVVGGAPPGSSLGTLSGSLDPVLAGIYTYSAASNMDDLIGSRVGTKVLHHLRWQRSGGLRRRRQSGGWLVCVAPQQA